MDQEEVARRLAKIRETVHEQLRMEDPSGLCREAPAEKSLRLERDEGPQVRDDLPLNSTPDLEECNRRATITQPISISSSVPVFGPVLTFIRRLARPIVQAVLDPYLDRQEQFNSYLVRHLNELGNKLEQRVQALEPWSANPLGIEARLVRALEDYDAALRQRHMVLFGVLEEELLALQSLARDAGQRRSAEIEELWQKLVQRSQAVDRRFVAIDQRFEQQERALEAATGALDRAEILALRRQLKETVGALRAGKEAGLDEGKDAPRRAGEEEKRAPAREDLAQWLVDEDYRAFQAAFRGHPEEIRQRLDRQVERFVGVPGVVADLGCGRGEFLQLLEEAGHEAVGVEINASDAEESRRRGMNVVVSDLLVWLQAQRSQSLGGIFLAQVIEHLPPLQWQRLLELAAARLKPGGRLVIETINPQSLYALVRAYLADPTHVRPVHPTLLDFLARRAGFHPVEVEYQASVPDEERPAALPVTLSTDAAGVSLIEAINERLERIDRLCCGPQEYTLCASLPVKAEMESG
ncbi:MAG: methyltransferase domain-containing protein [Acidobacteriota bacterium]